MKKVKGIHLKLEFEGNGVVNYDGGEQKYIIKKLDHMSHLRNYNDNVSYAKKVISSDGYKLKISNDCLRNSLFSDSQQSTTPQVTYNIDSKYMYLASPSTLLKGFLFMLKNNENIGRSTCFSLSDAIQTNNAISMLETFSSSGEKKKKMDVDERSDNTFFMRESVGDMTYESIGRIDFSKMGIISADQSFGRFSFNPDEYEIFKKYLKLSLPKFNANIGYYLLKTSSHNIPELGVKLNGEQQLFLLKYLLKRLFTLSINRRSAYARISKISYKLILDATEDLFDNQDGWETIESVSDIESLNFPIEEFYNEVESNEAIKLLESIKKKKESLLNAETLLTKAKKKEKEDKKKKKE